MHRSDKLRILRSAAPLLALLPACAHASEHITLTNGFELDCARREILGDRMRLYSTAAPDAGFVEIPTASVRSIELRPDPPAAAPVAAQPQKPEPPTTQALLTAAGAAHRIDVALLAAVVHAESNYRADAVSRTGARGLMQLMPGTAAQLGVQNSFAPDQNIAGGTEYLDQLLTRYHDDLALALAAYNAGPKAVDRYHGVPPFAETRAYVARIIREFNRRVTAARLAEKQPAKAAPLMNQTASAAHEAPSTW